MAVYRMRRRVQGFGDVTSAPGAPQYPVGSFGDQYNNCIAAGGDPASCATALLVPSGGSASGSSMLLGLAGIAFIALFALAVKR